MGPRWIVLLGVVLLQVSVALYPFDLNTPREYVNDVHRTADGVLSTGVHNRAVTTSPPAWLAEAIADERLRVDLVVRTDALEQAGPSGPAHILALSEGEWQSNLTIGQQGRDLAMWLRRPGTEGTGEPPFVVPDVFTDLGWHEILVVIDGTLTVTVDGRTRLVEPLPRATFATWDPDYRLAVGDEHYGRWAWSGDLKRAEVGTATSAVDYVDPGALAIPPSYTTGLYRPWEPVIVGYFLHPANELLHVVLFVPVGMALRHVRRPRLGHATVLVVAAVLAFFLQSAKMLVAARHPSVVDIPWMTLGALIGSLLYAAALRAGHAAGRVRENRTTAGAGA